MSGFLTAGGIGGLLAGILALGRSRLAGAAGGGGAGAARAAAPDGRRFEDR